MDILEDNLRTFHGKFIDNLGYSLLISRNRVGAENNRIVWFDRDLLVDVGCHTGKSRHGLTLASCCDQNHLIIRIILDLIDLDQSVFRNTQIPQFRRYGNNIDHTASLHCYLSSETICSIDDLLYTVYIGCKGRNNDPRCPVLVKQTVKHLSDCSFGHGKSRTFCVGTVAHQGKDTLLSNLGKTLQIDRVSEYRCIIHLKVTCVYYDSRRRIDCQGRRILDTVVCLDKFDCKIAKVDHLAMLYFF